LKTQEKCHISGALIIRRPGSQSDELHSKVYENNMLAHRFCVAPMMETTD
jgi:hypothetical protein